MALITRKVESSASIFVCLLVRAINLVTMEAIIVQQKRDIHTPPLNGAK